MPAPEQMSMPQLYDVIYHALALGDSTLQIWTSFTFALIVAVPPSRRSDRALDISSRLESLCTAFVGIGPEILRRCISDTPLSEAPGGAPLRALARS